MYAVLLAEQRRIRTERELASNSNKRRHNNEDNQPSRKRRKVDSQREAEYQRLHRLRNQALRDETAFYTSAELDAMDSTLNIKIPTDADLARLQSSAVRMFEASTGEGAICCVCELLHPMNDVQLTPLTDTLAENLTRLLRIPDNADIPEFILKQYDASALDARMKDLLLFPPAIHRENDSTVMQVCRDCFEYISNKSNRKPPAFAIANGNYVGWLPQEFPPLSRTDEQAIALVAPCVSISTVTGGNCKTIRSHHYMVKNTEGPIVSMLPHDISERVRVTIVGNLTSEQDAACRKRYELNVEKCRQVVVFLMENNKIYREHKHEWQFNANESCRTRIIQRTGTSTLNSDSDSLAEAVRDYATYNNAGSAIAEGSDKSLENCWIGTSSLIMQPPSVTNDVVIRKSNAFVSADRWKACVQMFPTLFPGGCGGPTEKRLNPISVERWIQRLLHIGDHRFETHYAFLLLAFDYLALQSARQALHIKLHVSSDALKAGLISRDVIRRSVEYHTHVVTAEAHGKKPNPPPKEVQQVINLRRGLRTSETAFYGSNLSRMRARHDLFGYIKRFGPLQLFFTVSPDTAGTYTIAEQSGILPHHVIEEANTRLLPNRADRKRIANNHPMQCALYFDRIMTIIIEGFLGWDQKTHQPKRGGGSFGVVRAFGAAAETQQGGDLHAHFAVWLHGFPTTSQQMKEAISSSAAFTQRLTDYVDCISTTSIPVVESPNRCFNEDAGELKPVAVGIDGYRKPLPGQHAPITSCCQICNVKYRDKDVINAAIDVAARRNAVKLSPENIDFIRCSPPRNNGNNSLSALELSLIVRDVQVHYWSHANSCFKPTRRTPKGSVCRFFKPHEPRLENTCIDDENDLQLSRPIGSEYVNAYNRTLMQTLKCNHDVQLVLGASAKNTAAYICKYCMKKQNPIENEVRLSVGVFTKAVEKADRSTHRTAERRGYKLLSSMLYALTNGQEVAAPMAALYIHRGSPFWFSHEHTYVNLERMLQSANSPTVEITIPEDINSDSNGPVSNGKCKLSMYWKRQKELDNVNFITICEWYHSEKKQDADGALHFEKNAHRQLFIMSGKQLPDLNANTSDTDRNFYYLVLLTLFKPHREGRIVEGYPNTECAYVGFKSTCSALEQTQMREFEEKWIDYYRSEAIEKEEQESQEDILLRTKSPARAPSQPYDREAEVDNDNFSDEASGDGDNSDNEFETYMDQLISETLYTCPIDAIQNLRSTINNTCDNYSQPAEAFLPAYTSLEDYTEHVTSYNSHNNTSTGTSDFIAAFPEAKTRLERLQDCFEAVPWGPDQATATSITSIPAFPSIETVSNAFNFNFWQHAIFEIAARHLLFAYLSDIKDALQEQEPIFPEDFVLQPYAIKEQLIAYVGGEAGTGKSRVILALVLFAEKWGREGSVETLAFTGVAAMNIKGRTIHSARNLQLNGTQSNSPPSLQMKNAFQKVVLVIMDEISMTDQGLLGSADMTSRAMSDQPHKIMGGKHAMYFGDWL